MHLFRCILHLRHHHRNTFHFLRDFLDLLYQIQLDQTFHLDYQKHHLRLLSLL